MRYFIRITEEDIADGQRCHILACPIANALKRCFQVGVAYAQLKELGVAGMVAKTPLKVRRIMLNYDKGRKIKPFTFYANFHKVEHLKRGE